MEADTRSYEEPVASEPGVSIEWWNPTHWMIYQLSRPWAVQKTQAASDWTRAEQIYEDFVLGVLSSVVALYGSENVILTQDVEEGWIVPLQAKSVCVNELPLCGSDGELRHEILTFGDQVYHLIRAELRDMEIGVTYVKCRRSHVSGRGL